MKHIIMLCLLASSNIMLIKSSEFMIDKLLILFYIAWLLQLKKIPNNQIKINETILNQESTTPGLVTKRYLSKNKIRILKIVFII